MQRIGPISILILLLGSSVGLAQSDSAPVRATDAPRQPVQIPDVDTTGMKKDSLDALRHAQDDVRADPARHGNWARLGAIFDARQLYEEAGQCYREAARLLPEEFDYHYMLARVADIVGDEIETILALYGAAEALDPKYPPLHFHKGACYGRYGKLEEARDSFAKALYLKADYPAAELGLGQALLNLGQAEEALKHLTRAASAAPEERSVNTALARAYMQTGQPELARRAAERSKEQSRGLDDEDRIRKEILNQTATSHDAMHRAERSLAEGLYEQAIPDLRIYLEGRPGSYEVRYSLAYSLYHTNRKNQALAECLQIIATEPTHSESKILAAQIYLEGRQKKSKEALTLLSEVVAREPENFLALLIMGNELARIGQAGPAVRAFERAYGKAELNSLSHHSWGMALLQLERLEEACQHLRTATVLDSKNALAFFNYGFVLGELERWDAAIKAYERALELNPRLPGRERIEALRALKKASEAEQARKQG